MASLGVGLLSLPLSLLLSSLLLLLFLSADNFSFGECSLLLHSNSTSLSDDDFNVNNLLEMVTDEDDLRQRRPPPPVRRPPPPVRRPPPPVRRPPPPVRRPPPPVRRPPPPPVRRPPPPPVRRPPPPPVRRPPPPPVRRPPPPPNRSPPPPPLRTPPPPPLRTPPPPPFRPPPPPSPDVKPPEFSNYRLGLQWAPAICSQEHVDCKTPVPDRFVIGSLQPISGSSPHEYCNPDDELDYHALVEELDEGPEHRLSTYWPNLLDSEDDEEHLRKEWAKYGTCSGLSQVEYFQTALGLYETIDIFTKLEEIGVHPGDRVDPSGLVSKYRDEFGILPLISCVNRPMRPFMELLGEIQFLINKDGETVESITGATNLCMNKIVLFIEAE